MADLTSTRHLELHSFQSLSDSEILTDAMAEYHRKIELQSPDDLQYLILNVRRAANQKIDKDLPPIEGEDKMRRRVEELVQEVHSSPSPVPISPSPSSLLRELKGELTMAQLVHLIGIPYHLPQHLHQRPAAHPPNARLHAHKLHLRYLNRRI